MEIGLDENCNAIMIYAIIEAMNERLTNFIDQMFRSY
jgi:hypothetical protein